MTKIRKNNKGITLIALIITIIVLIILSALAIGITLKGDLFGKAQTTISKANEGQVKAGEQAEDIELDWNNLPGESIKSPTTGETTIEIEVIPTNIKHKSFRINARGTNAEGDILTFTLNVAGKGNLGEKIGNEVYWDVTGLTPDTEYAFEVIAKDDETENSVSGTAKTLPNTNPEVTVAISNLTSTKVTITANGTDADGDQLTYTLTINGKTYGPSTTNTWNITGLTKATTYQYKVIVRDDVGGEGIKEDTITTLNNSAPVIVTNSLSSKTTTEIQIAAKATDADGDSLTYALYTSTSQTGTYTKKATSSSVTQNTQVTLSATGLTNYTTYWWYITVSDGSDTVTSEKQSVKTYCPGGTTETCSTCNGNGTVSYTCTDGYRYTCSTCSGSGKIPCPGTPTLVDETYTTCPSCGNSTGYRVSNYKCSTCGVTGYGRGCDVCGFEGEHTNKHANSTITCTSCGGSGYSSSNLCEHGRYTSHTVTDICSNCSGNGTVSVNCSHGYMEQHD